MNNLNPDLFSSFISELGLLNYNKDNQVHQKSEITFNNKNNLNKTNKISESDQKIIPKFNELNSLYHQKG